MSGGEGRTMAHDAPSYPNHDAPSYPSHWRTLPREGQKAPPLARAHMPGDHAISLHAYTKGGTLRVPEPGDYGPEQALDGFDPAYRNIVDYIVRITHRIWEGGADHKGEREVDYIADCYAPDSRVFDDYGLQHGNAKIIADTHATTGTFPDVELHAEDVIWAGDADVGFHTSHRCRIVGTHTNGGRETGRYGAATGRGTDYLVIANCVARGNDIHLEHVLYNSGAMLAQLGRDPMEEAARLAADPPAGWPRDAATWDALRREGGPPRPLHETEPVEGFDPDRFVRELHDELWNAGGTRALRERYADGFAFEGAGLRAHEGAEPHAAYLASLRETFPDLRLQVDETYWMGNEREGWSVATRWSAGATHRGGDLYGAPTDAPVQVWGITQQEIREGRVLREWQLFNELDVMMQIARARKG